MTRNPLSPAGEHASNDPLRPNFSHKKAPIIADRGGYSVRTSSAPELALLALRITPKTNFGAIRNESFCE